MRTSTDFFVVAVTGLGTALFLTQLLIVSQQIVSANSHIQAELAAEKTAVPVNWMDAIRHPVVERPPYWPGPPNPGCCIPYQPAPWPARDVGKAVSNPIVIRHPVYPARALDQQIEGYVDFTFILRSDGSITDARVQAEVPEGYGFASAAMRVFPQWRFEPLKENGKATPTPAHYRMRFKLS